MIAALAFLLSQAVTPPPVLPTNWTILPELRFIRPWQPTPEVNAFVHGEVIAGRCRAATNDDGDFALSVPIVVHVASRGHVKQIVPIAIGCPTVEQYASGIVSRMARDNLGVATGWFRTTIVFAWRQ